MSARGLGQELEDADRLSLVGGIAAHRRQAQEPVCSRRVARWRRVVIQILAPGDQLLVVIGGREETAVDRVGEVLDHRVRDLAGRLVVARLE